MTKIRMNTELRNKLFNKIKNVFENEDTQEREAYLKARETVNDEYVIAQQFAKEVVERAYPPEDVATLRTFKRKYGDPCDVVAKDKCFYFAHNEGVDDEGEPTETKYDNIDNSFDVCNQSDDMDKAIDMLQGYKLIETDTNVSYTMLKYDNEKPFDLDNSISEVNHV